MKTYLKYILTGAVVLIAAALVLDKYWDYVVNPWTRNGQVRAQVIQITPRVSGQIVELPIVDNQFVNSGDLLFKIDRRRFEASLSQASAELDNTRDTIESLAKVVDAAHAEIESAKADIKKSEAAIRGYSGRVEETLKEYQRQQALEKKGATSKRMLEEAKADHVSYVNQLANAKAQLMQMQAKLAEAEANLAKAQADQGAPGERNARIRKAKAAVRQAELDLEFTEVRAPVDGYVTNLNLRSGSHAVENQPALALVDVGSYWIVGYFRENSIGNIGKGDQATVTLMSYPDKALRGRVDSVGWGIAQQDGSTGFDLLPSISPTFEWIRLAQRVPVRVHLDTPPPDVKLRVGTTASVLVMTGTGGKESGKTAVPAPRALQ